jgi:hypothetical protein
VSVGVAIEGELDSKCSPDVRPDVSHDEVDKGNTGMPDSGKHTPEINKGGDRDEDRDAEPVIS